MNNNYPRQPSKSEAQSMGSSPVAKESPTSTPVIHTRPITKKYERRRLKRRRPDRSLITLCIILCIALTFSVALNVALLMSHSGKMTSDTAVTSEGTVSTSMKTEPQATTSHLQTEDSVTTKPEPDEDPLESQIEELLELIKEYSSAAQSGFDEQKKIYDTLFDLLRIENRPIHIHTQMGEVSTDNGNENTEETAHGDTEPLKTPADVSFAYVDLISGYTLSFNGDEDRYTASLIKAPYVLALLKEIDEFEKRKHDFAADGTPLYDEDGNALFEGDHPNYDKDGRIIYLEGEEKYDLSRKWVYDSKTMFVNGSGKIINQNDGFTLTYRELIEYTLIYSDNIAFQVLANEFGSDSYHALASSLGITGTEYNFMQLSANDFTLFLKETYEYFGSGSAGAEIMEKAMIDSTYNVMIPASVSPLKCAHKYGWDIDSYHDMGIVYHERPYALVIMTDLDNGRYEDYAYMQKISKAILDLHNSFTPDANGSESADSTSGAEPSETVLP